MLRKLAYIVLLLLVVAGTVLVVHHYRKPGSRTVLDAQSMDMSSMTSQVGTIPVRTGPVRRVWFAPTATYTGTVHAWNDEEVVARVTGRVTQVYVYPGDHVHAGELLARLDSDELTSRLQEAQAATDAARAKVQSSQSAILRSRAGTSSAKSEVDRARLDEGVAISEELSTRVTLDYWNAELERTMRLYDGEAVSLEELQKATDSQATARNEHYHKLLEIGKARAMKAEAEQAVLAQRAGLGEAEAGRAEATSAQAQMRAAQGTAAILLSYTEIRSQDKGTVTERVVSPGTLVMPGTVLLRLKQEDRIRLQVEVPVEQAETLRVGTPVHYGQPGTPQRLAHLTSIARAADPRARTATVEAVVRDHALFPGAYVEMTLDLSPRRSRLTVPLEAIQRDLDNRTFVWVLHGSAAGAKKASLTVKRRNVTLAGRSGMRAAVSKGLSPGAEVVVTGSSDLRDGEGVTRANKLSSARAGSTPSAAPTATPSPEPAMDPNMPGM
jgi:RND family efflux transporter MFP subunit